MLKITRRLGLNRTLINNQYLAVQSHRSMSDFTDENEKPLKGREKAFEDMYFNKKDKEALQNLLNKLRRNVEPTIHEHNAEKVELKKILAKYKLQVPETGIEELLTWKRGSFETKEGTK